jgi:hypothetical protein
MLAMGEIALMMSGLFKSDLMPETIEQDLCLELNSSTEQNESCGSGDTLQIKLAPSGHKAKIKHRYLRFGPVEYPRRMLPSELAAE